MCCCSKDIKVKIDALDDNFIPVYKHEGDAGADVRAYRIPVCEDGNNPVEYENASSSPDGYDWSFCLRPGSAVLVDCGFSCELPPGYAFLVCPRSGLAINNYITVLNAPGICDAGYRGSYGVILFNAGECEFHIQKGDRIAQIVLTKTPKAEFTVCKLTGSDRGTDGFGSSGVSDSSETQPSIKTIRPPKHWYNRAIDRFCKLRDFLTIGSTGPDTKD